MVDLSVRLGGIELKNPIIPASGTCGFGEELSELFPLDRLGAIAVKGTTLQPRAGNPLPRIAEAPSGMLNAVGLENPGIDAVLAYRLPALRRIAALPIILNISGFSADEYAECCRRADGASEVDLIELNISCPNVHGGGMSFGTDPRMAAAVTQAARRATAKPLFVKLSPNVTSIAEIARACVDAGADGLSLINTVLAMRIDIRRRRPVLANKTGGLSGPAIFPIAVRAVWDVASAVDVPIIGGGGVASAASAIELMMAGATAVEVGAAALTDPFACEKIVRGLPDECAALGIESISDIIGAARR